MDRETDLSAFICVEAVVATRGVVVLQYSRYLLSLSLDEAISVLTSSIHLSSTSKYDLAVVAPGRKPQWSEGVSNQHMETPCWF